MGPPEEEEGAEEAIGSPAPGLGWHSPALKGLFVIAAIHALYVGRSFAVPVVIALLLSFVLAPAVRLLRKLWVPAPLAAALVLVLVVVAAGGAVYGLAGPAATWIEQLPRSIDRLESRVGDLRGSVENMREATDRVEEMATLGDEEEPQQVEMAGTGLGDSLFQLTVGFFVQLFFVIVLLYALLASGELLVDKLMEVVPGVHDRDHMASIAGYTERQISRYLFTVTMINTALGVVSGLAMFLLGMPNPFLWGFIAGLFNFVPIIGSMVTSSVLLLVATSEFSDFWRIVLPPLVFLALTGLEAYFVTPAVLAQRLTLNLVVVFLSLFFWGWLWGPAGALLAVPMLAALKIVSDQIDAMAPVSRLLGS